ncbi:hypothetical protein [Paraburkholderia adhaesiva]|nr:hypothetical protein [Paraburkholderia adhaesiva]
MNMTSRNPLPATPNATPSKSLTLLQFLALIGVAGIAVSLAARYFL